MGCINNRKGAIIKKIYKDYKEWMCRKSEVHNQGKGHYVNEGDVVWVAVGENVGVEIDGKSEKYSRPVVVLRKHSSNCFTGIPLTTKKHNGDWYVYFTFQGREEVAVLIQARLFDTARVYSRIGKLSNGDYRKVATGFLNLFK